MCALARSCSTQAAHRGRGQRRARVLSRQWRSSLRQLAELAQRRRSTRPFARAQHPCHPILDLGPCVAVQVDEGADLLSERTETENKKLKGVSPARRGEGGLLQTIVLPSLGACMVLWLRLRRDGSNWWRRRPTTLLRGALSCSTEAERLAAGVPDDCRRRRQQRTRRYQHQAAGIGCSSFGLACHADCIALGRSVPPPDDAPTPTRAAAQSRQR